MLRYVKRSLMSWVGVIPFRFFFLEKKNVEIFIFILFFIFYFFEKSMSYQKKGGRGLLLVWHRLRPLGTFSRNAALLYDYNDQQRWAYNLKFSCVLYIKVTRHSCFKNSKNLRPLDILAYNSANKPSFQNPTKNLFVQCSIDVKSAMSLRGFKETKFWEEKIIR